MQEIKLGMLQYNFTIAEYAYPLEYWAFPVAEMCFWPPILDLQYGHTPSTHGLPHCKQKNIKYQTVIPIRNTIFKWVEDS